MKLKYLLILIVMTPISVYSQNKQDFDSYRKEMINNYQSFRKGIINEYDNFLEGIWKNYQIFVSGEKDTTPKPTKVPDITSMPVSPNPAPISPIKSQPQEELPTPSIKPNVPSIPNLSQQNKSINFYGLPILLPTKRIDKKVYSLNNKHISAYWRELTNNGWEDIAKAMLAIKTENNYNDFMFYLLAKEYVNSNSNNNDIERNIQLLFCLTACGYDARIGYCNDILILLLPFNNQLYSRMYITQGNKKYYVFSDKQLPRKGQIYTYEIPENKNNLSSFNVLVNNNPKLANKEHRYNLSDGHLSISGIVNKNLITLLDQLPQMDNQYYAYPVLEFNCREQIVKSLKMQLQGKTKQVALEELLHFVQFAFKYATDDEQFGREKPFFFEELLYYPLCDCEDRSVFFAYLVKEVLNLDCHLLDYPGHIAVAVAIDGVSGSYYTHNGIKYYITDPTYIGASIGDCMPRYSQIKPVILTIK